MPRRLKIFLMLTGVFFVCSSLEIDVFDYDNTFFDSYDTYVHTDSTCEVDNAGHQQDPFVLFDFSQFVEAINSKIPQKEYSTPELTGQSGSPPLFITNSVWRI